MTINARHYESAGLTKFPQTIQIWQNGKFDETLSSVSLWQLDE